MSLIKFGMLVTLGYFLAITLIQGNEKKEKIAGVAMLIGLTLITAYYGWLEIQATAIGRSMG